MVIASSIAIFPFIMTISVSDKTSKRATMRVYTMRAGRKRVGRVFIVETRRGVRCRSTGSVDPMYGTMIPADPAK